MSMSRRVLSSNSMSFASAAAGSGGKNVTLLLAWSVFFVGEVEAGKLRFNPLSVKVSYRVFLEIEGLHQEDFF